MATATAKEKTTAKAKETTEAVEVETIDVAKVSGADLVKALEAAVKSAVTGKVDRVQKQNYVRLMSGKTLICYLRASKAHALIQLELPVNSDGQITEAAQLVKSVLDARPAK